MLRFSPAQIEAMNDRADDEMAELWARIIRDVFPNDVAHLSESELLSATGDHVRDARFAGLENGEDIGLYVQACLFLTPDFPEKMPELARILTDDRIPLEERQDALSRREAGLAP